MDLQLLELLQLFIYKSMRSFRGRLWSLLSKHSLQRSKKLCICPDGGYLSWVLCSPGPGAGHPRASIRAACGNDSPEPPTVDRVHLHQCTQTNERCQWFYSFCSAVTGSLSPYNISRVFEEESYAFKGGRKSVSRGNHQAASGEFIKKVVQALHVPGYHIMSLRLHVNMDQDTGCRGQARASEQEVGNLL